MDRILDIYRNKGVVQVHFSSRHYSQPSVHQVSADSNFPKEGGEEDIHKLHKKEGATRIPDFQAQRIDTSTVVAEHATGVETATSHENAQHMVNSA